MDNASTSYVSCWGKYEHFRKEYLRLVDQARKAGETLAQNADTVELIMIQDGLEGLLEESSVLSVAARQHLQSATTSLLYAVTSAICDAYLFAADNAADFESYAIQDDLEVM